MTQQSLAPDQTKVVLRGVAAKCTRLGIKEADFCRQASILHGTWSNIKAGRIGLGASTARAVRAWLALR